MDLINSGSYIGIFYAKTCATTKISTWRGTACNAFIIILLISVVMSYDLKAVTKEKSTVDNFTTLAGFEPWSPRQKSSALTTETKSREIEYKPRSYA